MSFRSLKLLDPSEVPSRVQLLNPFVHKLEMDNPVDKIKTAIFTVLLLPFRVICICILLIVAWLLACIGLCGMTQEELKNRPMIGWRRALRQMAAHTLRIMYFVGSFHYIQYKGVCAKRKDAPILCIAPHSSFFDSILAMVLGAPAVVAKAETASIPFFGTGGISIKVYGKQASRNEAPILVIAPHTTFLDSIVVYVTNMSSIIVRMESMDNYIGKLINFTQPIYVWRDDPNSRHNTIKSIIERAKSEEDWAQILIFPEGTCTNRSCLIEFKPGAFYPGVPIQPVCIRYPNKLDTVTWTWEGPGVLKLLWLTLTQIHSSCEIEFLPVYHPSEEEKSNPKLYAHNVRNVMSKALDIPTSEYTFDDCRLMTRAKNMNLPCAVGIVDFVKLRKAIGLDKTNIEEKIVYSTSVNDTNYNINITEFSLLLQIPIDENSKKLFSLFDREECGIIDFREYLLCAIFIIKSHEPVIKLIYYAFKIYESTSLGTGCLNADSIYRLFKHTMAMSSQESAQLFLSIDVTNRGYITFDEFAAYGKTEYPFLFKTETDGKSTKKINNMENNNDIIKEKDN